MVKYTTYLASGVAMTVRQLLWANQKLVKVCAMHFWSLLPGSSYVCLLFKMLYNNVPCIENSMEQSATVEKCLEFHIRRLVHFCGIANNSPKATQLYMSCNHKTICYKMLLGSAHPFTMLANSGKHYTTVLTCTKHCISIKKLMKAL